MSYHVELKSGRCLPCREIQENWLSQLLSVEVGTANSSVEQSRFMVGTGKLALEVCRNVLPCQLKGGRCLPYLDILEYWLSQLSTVEEVGTANNSVERSKLIV